MHDVIIVGGGPAGLAAAVVLGRGLRKVLLVDEAKPRNVVSSGVRAYLGLDGVTPAELRRRGREEAQRYGVEIREARVAHATRTRDRGFEVVLETNDRFACRKLLLATGVVDRLPDIPGATALYGRGLYPCVYCDAYELRGRPLGAYSASSEQALALTTWTREVIAFTDGRSIDERDRLARHGVRVCEGKIEAFVGDDALTGVRLANGETIPCRGVILDYGQRPQSALAIELGCEIDVSGSSPTRHRQQTCVDGLYIAGDAGDDVELAIVAAAAGARAAHHVHHALRVEDTR